MRSTLLRCSVFVLLTAPAALKAQFGVEFVASHAATSATSANHRLQLSPIDSQAYRPFALAVAVIRNHPQHRRVFVRRSGPAFVGVHGVDAAGDQAWRSTRGSSGYRPVLLACSSDDDRMRTRVHDRLTRSFLGFDRITPRRGFATCASIVLCCGLGTQPNPLPGIGSSGIGAIFTQPWTFPAAIPFDLSSVPWSEPDLGDLRLHCHGVAVDPRSIIAFPLPTTDARSARGS